MPPSGRGAGLRTTDMHRRSAEVAGVAGEVGLAVPVLARVAAAGRGASPVIAGAAGFGGGWCP
jgi:hypothetical protein